MKRTILSVVILVAVFGVGMLVGSLKSQSVSTSMAVAAPAPVAMAIPIPQERRCPAIHEAIRALEAAEGDMREARHDFCGHKHDAMEITHHAIEQLRMAENCDKCR